MIKLRFFVQGEQETKGELEERINKDIINEASIGYDFKDAKIFVTDYGWNVCVIYTKVI